MAVVADCGCWLEAAVEAAAVVLLATEEEVGVACGGCEAVGAESSKRVANTKSAW